MAEEVPGYPIFINKVSNKVSEENLKEIFSNFGEIIYLRLIKKKFKPAFSILSFETEDERAKAIASMDGGMIDNFTIAVRIYEKESRKKDNDRDNNRRIQTQDQSQVEERKQVDEDQQYRTSFKNDRREDSYSYDRFRRGESRGRAPPSYRDRERGRSPPRGDRFGSSSTFDRRGKGRETSTYTPIDRGNYYDNRPKSRDGSRSRAPAYQRRRSASPKRNIRSRSRSPYRSRSRSPYNPRGRSLSRSRSRSPYNPRGRSLSRSRSSSRSPYRSRSRSPYRSRSRSVEKI